MRRISSVRLLKLGWQSSMFTGAHTLWYKKNWQCSINKDTGQVHFSRVLKIDTVDLMRGPVEKGIE